MSIEFISEIATANKHAKFDTSDKKASSIHKITSWGLPIVVGIGTGILAVDYAKGALQVAIPILVSLSLALLVFVFQLRIEVSRTERKKSDRLLALVDASFTSTTYSIIIGIVCILLGIVAGAFGPPALVGRIISGVSFAVSTHYLLVLLLVLRRIYRSYRQYIK